MHFPSLYSALLAVSNTHTTEGKKGSEGSLPNPPFSLIMLCCSHAFCQPVLKREKQQSATKGAPTERTVTSFHPVSCPAAAWLLCDCLDCFLGNACNRYSCSAVSAKIPGFVTQLGLLWELAIDIPLEEAVLQREAQDAQHLLAPQHYSQGRTIGVRRAQFRSAHTVNWVRFKERGGYFWSRC